MQLNCVCLRLTPLPYELDGEASRYYDAFFPELFSVLEAFPEAKLGLTISGFLLEKLEARSRTAFLKRLAEYSHSQIALLSFPFYDPSALLLTTERYLEQLEFQRQFWSSYGAQLAPTIDATTDPRIAAFVADQPGVEHFLYVPDVGSLPAVTRLDNGALATPAHPLPVSSKTKMVAPTHEVSSFALGEKVRLRSLVISITDHTPLGMERLLLTLRAIFTLADQGFLLPADFAFPNNAAASVQLPSRPAADRLLASRTDILWQQIEDVSELIEERAKKARAESRVGERHGPEAKLKSARRYAHRASSRVLDQPNVPAAQRSALELMLYGEVDFEAYLHPDVDPVVGWVRWIPQKVAPVAGAEGVQTNAGLVSTQLADYFISADGALLEWDFKPRKCALVGTTHFKSFLIHPSIPPVKRTTVPMRITRKTLDLVSLRFVDELTYPSGTIQLFRELTFKAGIGAHLANATTGFSFEYWIEDAPPPGLQLICTTCITLPTPQAAGGNYKPLLCVGGVGAETYPPDEPLELGGTAVPGGAFGIRAIDTVEDLLIDLRTSKQLEGVRLNPLHIDGLFQGTICEFIVSASRVRGDEHSNTVFISVF